MRVKWVRVGVKMPEWNDPLFECSWRFWAASSIEFWAPTCLIFISSRVFSCSWPPTCACASLLFLTTCVLPKLKKIFKKIKNLRVLLPWNREEWPPSLPPYLCFKIIDTIVGRPRLDTHLCLVGPHQHYWGKRSLSKNLILVGMWLISLKWVLLRHSLKTCDATFWCTSSWNKTSQAIIKSIAFSSWVICWWVPNSKEVDVWPWPCW